MFSGLRVQKKEDVFDEEEGPPLIEGSPIRIESRGYGSFPSSLSLRSLDKSLTQTQSVASLSTMYPEEKARYIRFQVVIWHIGPVDAVLGKK